MNKQVLHNILWSYSEILCKFKVIDDPIQWNLWNRWNRWCINKQYYNIEYYKHECS